MKDQHQVPRQAGKGIHYFDPQGLSPCFVPRVCCARVPGAGDARGARRAPCPWWAHNLMNPVNTGRCIGEAQEVAETGKAWQPRRSRRREGRVQKSRDNASGAGDTWVSSNVGRRLFILCPCLHPLMNVWVGVGAWGVVGGGLVSTFKAVPGASRRGRITQFSLFLPFRSCLTSP